MFLQISLAVYKDATNRLLRGDRIASDTAEIGYVSTQIVQNVLRDQLGSALPMVVVAAALILDVIRVQGTSFSVLRK